MGENVKIESKHDIMLRLSKEGHSFPHWDTCGTCEEDFEEVCKWQRKQDIEEFEKLKDDIMDIFEFYETEGTPQYKDLAQFKIDIEILFKQKLKQMETEK